MLALLKSLSLHPKDFHFIDVNIVERSSSYLVLLLFYTDQVQFELKLFILGKHYNHDLLLKIAISTFQHLN